MAVIVAMGVSSHATPLDEVLRAIPAGLSDWVVFFTDWTQIKANLGLGFLTSSSPLALRMEMGLRLSDDQAAASAYGLSRLLTHADDWGWDTADLKWEANIVTERWPPVYLLQFRDGFDFTPVIAHFAEREFTQTASYGARTYSHPLQAGVNWIRTNELSILNTALLPEEGLLLLTSSPAALEQVLATWMNGGPSAQDDSFAAAAIAHLDGPASAILLRGLGECHRFTPLPLLDLLDGVPTQEEIERIREQVADATLMLPYRALAVGYHQQEGRPAGTVVLEYDSEESAGIDLAARCLLATEGTSLRSERPLSETYFSVMACRVEDRAIVISVTPLDDRPHLLFRMIYTLDAVFAACSSP